MYWILESIIPFARVCLALLGSSFLICDRAPSFCLIWFSIGSSPATRWGVQFRFWLRFSPKSLMWGSFCIILIFFSSVKTASIGGFPCTLHLFWQIVWLQVVGYGLQVCGKLLLVVVSLFVSYHMGRAICICSSCSTLHTFFPNSFEVLSVMCSEFSQLVFFVTWASSLVYTVKSARHSETQIVTDAVLGANPKYHVCMAVNGRRWKLWKHNNNTLWWVFCRSDSICIMYNFAITSLLSRQKLGLVLPPSSSPYPPSCFYIDLKHQLINNLF